MPWKLSRRDRCHSGSQIHVVKYSTSVADTHYRQEKLHHYWFEVGVSSRMIRSANSHGSAEFFQGFNVLFPLFHQPSFEGFFERQYTNDPPMSSGWYAAFNIVLAISCRLRISHSPSKEAAGVPVSSHVLEAWKYFQNTATVLTELLLRNTDLMSIQAILGMVCRIPIAGK
jgi:hypothetical protein